MSNKRTVYDDVTFKWLHMGSKQDPKVQQFEADGKILVMGVYDWDTMYDSATQTVVPDPDKQIYEQDYEAQRQALLQRKESHRINLKTLLETVESDTPPDTWDAAQLHAALKMLIEMLEIPADTVTRP